MKTDQDKQTERDLQTYRVFKIHLSIYAVVITIIWLGLFAQGGSFMVDSWPVYISLGWGLIIILHCLFACRIYNKPGHG